MLSSTRVHANYKQLIHTPLFNLDLLHEIYQTPNIDIKTIENPVVRELFINQFITDNSVNERHNSESIFKANLKQVIDTTKKVVQLIQGKKIIPIDPGVRSGVVNKLSQRLLLKKDQDLIYYATHRELSQDSKAEITPKLAIDLQGIFVIMLVCDADGNYQLECRVNGLSENNANGHESLADGQHNSVILAGEIFICNGKCKLSSNKTGHYHKRIKDELHLTSQDGEVLLNFCLRGLGTFFYAMQLNPNSPTGIDDEDYERIKIANSIAPSCTSAHSSWQTINKKLQIEPIASPQSTLTLSLENFSITEKSFSTTADRLLESGTTHSTPIELTHIDTNYTKGPKLIR